MKVLIKDGTAYRIENGKLSELGSAEELEHIVGDVYKSSNETYVIHEDNISVLSDDSYPIKIAGSEVFNMPQRIKEFKNAFVSHATMDSKVCEAYFSMLEEFSESDYQNIRTNGVVLTRYSDSRLFVKDEAGTYVQKEDVIELRFDERAAFIYHGGLYVRDQWGNYRKVRFEPIVTAKTYMIFWSGQNNLFAMRQTGKTIKVIKLGALEQFFKTPHGVVIEVETEFCKYALYNLGKTLEFIFERRADEDYDLDTQTGGIAHYKTGFSNGYKTGVTDRYMFEKGHYTKLYLI